MNLFDDDNPAEGERFDELHRCRRVVIERIASSPRVDGKIYDQPHDEWVTLLRGAASLDIAGQSRDLAAGDHLFIAAHEKHRVTRCSADTVWLAIHIHPDPPTCEIVEAELAEVAALEAQIPEFETKYSCDEITARAAHRKHLCLIAHIDGEPVGYKLGYEQAAGRFYSWIGAVLPTHRRRGVARQLLHAQERWCAANGYGELIVKSENRYRSMLSMLIANGYDVFGIQTNGTIIFHKKFARVC